MEKIIISDAAENGNRVAYIYNAVASRLPLSAPRPRIIFGEHRAAIALSGEDISPAVWKLFASVAAEAIAVGCKYDYFSSRLKLNKLSTRRREIFMCALIAADLKTDAGYIRAGLKGLDSCALDGFFAFRLQALKKKWDKILGCIPQDFSTEEMDRFMKYLVDGNSGKVFVGENAVYDGDYRACKRGTLTGRAGRCYALETEIILSGASEVHVLRDVDEEMAAFLKKYYGSRAIFYAKNKLKRLDNRGAACYNRNT